MRNPIQLYMHLFKFKVKIGTIINNRLSSTLYIIKCMDEIIGWSIYIYFVHFIQNINVIELLNGRPE